MHCLIIIVIVYGTRVHIVYIFCNLYCFCFDLVENIEIGRNPLGMCFLYVNIAPLKSIFPL